jgi:hypothetical protein
MSQVFEMIRRALSPVPSEIDDAIARRKRLMSDTGVLPDLGSVIPSRVDQSSPGPSLAPTELMPMRVLSDTPQAATLSSSDVRPRRVMPETSDVSVAPAIPETPIVRSQPPVASLPLANTDDLLLPTHNVAPTIDDPSLLTRPRVVNPDILPSRNVEPVIDNQPFGSSGGPFRLTRDRRTQPRDYVAEDAQTIRDLNSAPIERSRAKSAGLGAQQGAAGGPIGAGIGALIGLLKPNLYGENKRDQALEKAHEQLQVDLGVAKEQAQTQAMQTVPVQLPNGQIVNVARNQAGSISLRGIAEGRQQSTAEAHKKRWEQLGRTERVQSIVREYRAGMLNDPDSLNAAADELGIPGEMKPAFIRGEMRDAIDEKGNLIQVNRQTGDVLMPRREGLPVQTYGVTQEAGRNDRFAQGQDRTDARQVRAIAAGNERQANQQTFEGRKLGDPQGMYDKAAGYWDQAQAKRKAADAIQAQPGYQLSTADAQRKAQLTREAEQLENQTRTLQQQGDRARNAQSRGTAAAAPSMTEQQIRDAARASGLDPDKAVQRAKQRGLL